ncbi:MAG TPA: hypothetical protein VHD61_11100 [Lacunisphaera sp.]|nr:hypothetical protein [Lacunisphaera sp.]
MKISYRTLVKLERGYSIALLPAAAGEAPSFLAGSEGEDRLLFFEAPDFKPKTISRSPGGYISICPLLNGRQRHVLAANMFKPGFNGGEASIRLYPLDGPECPPSTLVALMPFTHRLTLAAHAGRRFLLVSTLCAGKAHKDDWTQPGGIHLADLPADPAQPWPIRQIVRGLNKNHGMDYAELGRDRRPGYLLSAMEGLFFMPFPADPAGEWPLETISREENSDAFAFDWDGDGVPEIFSISPFHGHRLALHKQAANGWSRTLIHDDLSLGHIVWAGNLLGAPALLAGSRRDRRELRLYRPDRRGGVDPRYQVLAEGIGPSQLNVVSLGNRRALLYVAAHGVDEVRLYELET